MRGSYEIPNSKYQITNKSQIFTLWNPAFGGAANGRHSTGQVLNDQNRFGISNLVIVIYLIFDICDLEFPWLHYSSSPLHEGKTLKSPTGATQCQVRPRPAGSSMGPASLLLLDNHLMAENCCSKNISRHAYCSI